MITGKVKITCKKVVVSFSLTTAAKTSSCMRAH
jgi:hypothetical protein